MSSINYLIFAFISIECFNNSYRKSVSETRGTQGRRQFLNCSRSSIWDSNPVVNSCRIWEILNESLITVSYKMSYFVQICLIYSPQGIWDSSVAVAVSSFEKLLGQQLEREKTDWKKQLKTHFITSHLLTLNVENLNLKLSVFTNLIGCAILSKGDTCLP